MSLKYNLLIILGHTAGGKTAVAARVASRLGGEVISADSRQVYRGMDLGTGKDYGDYIVDGTEVPSHLIDTRDAGYEYNLFEFQQDFARAFTGITGRGKLPVLCGGTGLYLESVISHYRLLNVPANPNLRRELALKGTGELENMLEGYGPLHNVTDTSSRKRLIRAIEIADYQSRHATETSVLPDLTPLVTGIRYEREVRRQRITERLKERLQQGMVEEVQALLNSGIPHEKLRYYGLEYKYISMYLAGELTHDEMVSRLKTAIHQFAKRQMTYFRGMQRRGVPIHWIEGELPQEAKVEQIIALYRST
jgi:tRNA dimethylallyltransferase